MQTTVLITGSSGFATRRIILGLKAAGFNVISTTSDATKKLQPLNKHYDMTDASSSIDLNGVDVVVHASWIMNPRNSQTAQANLRASINLLQQISEKNIYTIFISTLSAHCNSKSFYGQSKFEAEKHFIKFKTSVIKPGLVIDRETLERGGSFNSPKKRILRELFSMLLSTNRDYPFTDSDLLVSELIEMILNQTPNCIEFGTGRISLSEILTQKPVSKFSFSLLTERRIRFILLYIPFKNSKLVGALEAFNSLIDSRTSCLKNN